MTTVHMTLIFTLHYNNDGRFDFGFIKNRQMHVFTQLFISCEFIGLVGLSTVLWISVKLYKSCLEIHT